MKNFSLNIGQPAQQDLRSIKNYIADTLNAPEAALKLISKIHDGFLRIKEFPFSGDIIKTEFPMEFEYRRIIVESYVIFYTVESETINIMRVLYGASNYLSVLD